MAIDQNKAIGLVYGEMAPAWAAPRVFFDWISEHFLCFRGKAG